MTKQRKSLVACCQNVLIFAPMALRRTHTLDAILVMLDAVPVPESGGPRSRRAGGRLHEISIL
jgi:hypothetical protein